MAMVLTVGAVFSALAPPAQADPPPTPLLWERKYVDEIDISPSQLIDELLADCALDLERGVRQNNGTTGARVAVIGDSVQAQMRVPALFDPKVHWMYATHCGETLATSLSSGRTADALGTNPDVLVVGLGSNDLTHDWRVDLSSLPAALAHLEDMFNATEGARCRVFYTLPMVPNGQALESEKAAWLAMTKVINDRIRSASMARHDFYVADWAETVAYYWPAYLADGLHLSRLGINTKMNLAIQTGRRCWAPDTPVGVGAVAGNGTATVWWDPLPEPEHVTSYRVTASDGRTITTGQPTVNFPGLANGVSYQFKVEAVNQSGVSTPSAWTGAVVPSPAGARFHATSPVRVLDTRSGVGGKGTSFGPGESFRLPLTGVVPPGASAAVLEITATGPTEQTFVTAWPGGQSRPLASNLNPRPGVNAVPAMVTTRVGPDGSIQLYNNSGNVHLIADVIGWYGAAGDASGSLYAATSPTRVLDTRDGTGGKATPFGGAEQFTLSLPSLPVGASAAVLNVTATDATQPGHVTVWPDGLPQPVASSLNPQPGLTRANVTTTKLGADNKVRIYNHSATTDLVIDLVGSYTAEGALTGGAQYFPITPERAYDTRDATGGIQGPVSNGSNLALAFAGRGTVPAAGVTAVDTNVTIVGPSAPGHTTIWPSGARPNTSVLNFSANEVVANRDSATLAGGGALVWSAAPSTHYIVDVSGWFGS